MATQSRQIRLTNEEISRFMEDLEENMQLLHIERKNALRLRLLTEEIFLCWQQRFGSEGAVAVTVKKRFGTLHVVLCLKGEACDPLGADSEERELYTQLLSGLGLAPVYQYKRGKNYITLKLSPQRDNSVLVLLLCVFAAVLLGALGLLAAPALAQSLLEQVLVPVRTTILDLLTAVAVPVVFFSVLQGILGVGDVASFGKIGTGLLARFLGKTAVYTAAAGAVMAPLFSLDLLGGRDVTGFGGALQMILDIFPATWVAPFADGNALQVIVIAIAFGLAVLTLDARADAVRTLSAQMNDVLCIVMEWVGRLIPLLIFLLVLETVWSGNVGGLLGLWKPIVILGGVCMAMMLAELLTFALRYRVSPISLAKKLLPSTLIAFSTSCAMAAFSVTGETCEKELGVHPKVTGFGLPIGLVMYMPAVSAYYLIVLFYGLERYDLSCSVQWLFIAWITVTLLAVATPPVSGGTMACFAVLLSQMAVPAEAITYALAMNVIADRFCAAADLSMLEVELARTAHRADLLDREALHRAKKGS